MKLIEGFDSNYRYILVAARRARQLQSGAPPVVDTNSRKPCRIAQDEIRAGKVKWEIPETRTAAEQGLRAVIGMPVVQPSAEKSPCNTTFVPEPKYVNVCVHVGTGGQSDPLPDPLEPLPSSSPVVVGFCTAGHAARVRHAMATARRMVAEPSSRVVPANASAAQLLM